MMLNHSAWVASAYISAKMDNTTLDSSVVASLREIAAKCPYSDGIAVFEARALLRGIDSVGTPYINSCETPAPELSNLRKANDDANGTIVELLRNGQANLYPNPTSNELFVEIVLNSTSNNKIELYDLTGKIVETFNLKTGLNKLSVQQIVTGVYLYRIFIEGEPTSSQKLIIIK